MKPDRSRATKPDILCATNSRKYDNLEPVGFISHARYIPSNHFPDAPMSLDESDINKLAVLARINISDKESRQVAERISSVLDLIDQLQARNTEAVEPMAHPMDAVQTLRADQVTEENQREALMHNAPVSEDGLFLVPKVID